MYEVRLVGFLRTFLFEQRERFVEIAVFHRLFLL